MLYRRRTLNTPHGSVETPVLFPVRNIGKRSSDNTPEYTRTIPDLQTAMVNARAVKKRDTQWQQIVEGQGLRKEMDVDEETVVFADSGGFDFVSGEPDISPEEVITVQREIGADLFGTVDLPLQPTSRESRNHRRIERGLELALRASDAHDGSGLLIASVHGYDSKTIRNNIDYLEREGEFDGYAVGSLVPIRNDYQKVTKLVLAARTATDKHLHVYGLGGHVYQPLLLYLGVDSFDSTSFIKSAGKRRYLVPGFGGDVLRDLEQLEYLPCSCPVCCDRRLDAIREDRDLLTRHNLWALTIELRRFRYVVESEKDIETYLDLRFEGNDVTKRAYEKAKQQVRRLS
ncbi:tRNA-guanine transglycosylase [Halobaculum sp. D14]|uniref:tRNA-guanine transglycosylase n=1 Tax=Halobaculum sp. D14 TaxID=3421642 RepID=UPI003EBE08B6